MNRAASTPLAIAALLVLAACDGREHGARGPVATTAAVPSAAAALVPAQPKPPAAKLSACLLQGSERLTDTPLRAVGTEPFWGARIAGRCVTYRTLRIGPAPASGPVTPRHRAAAPGPGRWAGAASS